MTIMKMIREPLQNLDIAAIMRKGIDQYGSQNAYAKAAEVDQGMVSNYLSGKKRNIAFSAAIDFSR